MDLHVALTGTSPSIEYVLASGDDEPEAPAGEALLSEDELLERLKEDFGAREVFDDDIPPCEAAGEPSCGARHS